MSAFNRRLEPKEMAGMPVEAVVSLVVSLVFGTLTMIAPGMVKIIPGLLCLTGIVATVFVFKFKNELQFVQVIILGKYIEPRRVTSETRTKF